MCTDGAADHGSLYQLRNILGRTNVGKDPTRDFNAYEDFFLEVISGHIIAAFHELKTANFNPLLDWMKDDKQRKEILLKISTEIVDKFVNFSTKVIKAPQMTRYKNMPSKYSAWGAFIWSFLIPSKKGTERGY